MYSKYHGCGNDFLISRYEENKDYKEEAINICNRHIGIGADGLILVKENNGELEMIFYNADGSRASMCGNGIRCFAKYCIDNGFINKDKFNVKTLAGNMIVEITQKKPFKCKVCLGRPDFSSKKLGIDTNKDCFLNEEIVFKNGNKVMVDAVYMATHHLIVIVDNLDDAIKSDLGYQLGNDKIFTKGINVNFIEIIDRNNIKMRTYERGVGWTLACGTGACASFVILNHKGLCDNHLFVHLPYGVLEISKVNDDIYMEGESECIARKINI